MKITCDIPLEEIYLKKDDTYVLQDDAYVFSVGKLDDLCCEKHRHNFIEIVYMLKGKCVHNIDGKDYPVRHGDMVIVNYNQSHTIYGNASGQYVNILLKPEYISGTLANRENAFELLNLREFEDFRKILDEKKCKVSFSGEERSRIEEIIGIIIDEYKTKAPGYELAVRSQFNFLIIMIFRKMQLDLDNRFDGVSDKLLNYLEVHCGEKLTLDTVARLCSYNSSYFSRIFKNYTGHNFISYLRKIRISKAAELISGTDIMIKDIMCEVGYTESNKFYADFKKVFGVSPLQYRKSKK